MISTGPTLRALAILILTHLAMSLAISPARSDQGYFIGDSISAATANTLGMPGAARHSVSLRRNTIAEHFARIPKGAVALMSLGLNDAAIPVQRMRHHIERVIKGALATGERIVWIGPPCVFKNWDVRAKEMDEYLRTRLAGTAIQYVSLRDDNICKPGMRSRDGEHFTISGYRYVWQKIRNDSSYAATIAGPAAVRTKRVAVAWVEPPSPRRNPRRSLILPRRPRP